MSELVRNDLPCGFLVILREGTRKRWRSRPGCRTAIGVHPSSDGLRKCVGQAKKVKALREPLLQLLWSPVVGTLPMGLSGLVDVARNCG